MGISKNENRFRNFVPTMLTIIVIIEHFKYWMLCSITHASLYGERSKMLHSFDPLTGRDTLIRPLC